MGIRKKIALLVGQADEYYQAEFITGFEKQAFEDDCDVCVFAMFQKYQSSAPREIGDTSVFSLIPYESFDGVVLMLDTMQTPGLADNIEAIVHERCVCPVISVDKKSRYFTSITPNHYEGVRAIITHLIEDHGYKDIAYLTGKAWHPYSKERLQAFLDTMQEHGLSVGKDRVCYGDFWYTSGENYGDRLFKSGKLPQAIACANDCMAVGLAKSLTSHGLRIPQDIAVVGYDSTEEARMAPVPITSVILPSVEFGMYAAKTVFNMMYGMDPEKFNPPVKLFDGKSCGCDRTSDMLVKEQRKVWDTDISSNSVYSIFNHMDEDMLIQNNFYGLMTTLFSYVYQIREFESFNILLNENWQKAGGTESSDGAPAEQLNMEMMRDTDRFYSKRMINVMSCRPEKLAADRMGMDVFFDRSQLVPRLNEDRDKPEAFVFTPLFFEAKSFGYSVVSYTEPQSYSESYRMWLRSLMRGLEYFRKQEEFRGINSRLESSLIRDPLTGLYNYRGFTQMMNQLLAQCSSNGKTAVGVMAIDIRDLAKINDSYGRETGDRIIVSMSRILSKIFPEGSVFCFGNGEMVVIDGLGVNGMKPFEDGLGTLNKLLDEYNAGSGRTAVDIYYGLSDGAPRDGDEFERLVGIALSKKNAQKMSFKSAGGGGLDANAQNEARMVNDILNKNKIKYHFQPIVDAHNGEIFAYEALMRVDVTPYIQPPVVLKYAETFDRLYDVESATFNNVLNIIDTRPNDFKDNSRIFINSIPGQRLKGEDAKRLADMAVRYSNRIVVELTEQTELDDADLNDMKLAYRDLGVQTAVDDYGTGYSNVSNLLRYMPNYVKIDRSLISENQNSPQKQHFVRDIISFSHDNDIMALAEGVETEEELRMVIHLGIDLIQGYYTARPMEKIVKTVEPSVREQIIQINQAEEETRNNSIYTAGREIRIMLSVLRQNGSRLIKITNGQVTYRDVTIVGAPGLEPFACIEIEDGYRGQITLETCSLIGKKKPASIIIGHGCDVTLVLKGENLLEGGGILVPEDSSLYIEGDGNLAINVNSLDGFGIGNDSGSGHGDLRFDQDGAIEIALNTTKGTAIGSGLGGAINIQKGSYLIRLSGQECVGIGSFEGTIEPVITSCAIEIQSTALSVVGIGSISGNATIMIERSSFVGVFTGNDVVILGTRSSDNTAINIYNTNVTVSLNCRSGVVFGSFQAKPTDIVIDYASVNINCEGKTAAIFRGLDERVRINITSSHIEGKVRTELNVPGGVQRMQFNLIHSSSRLDMNGHMIVQDVE